VYASRDEFFACTRLSDDEDAQVEARGDLDVLPDLSYQLGLADESVYHRRTVYISRLRSIRTRHYPGQNLNAERGEMGCVFKLAHNRAVQRFKEFHDKVGLPAHGADCEFIDPAGHGAGVRRFEFALQHPALRVLFGKEGKR
jgi:hypothetical protein